MARSWIPGRVPAVTKEPAVVASFTPTGTTGDTVHAALGALYPQRVKADPGTPGGVPWDRELAALYLSEPAVFGTLVDLEAALCSQLPIEVRRRDAETGAKTKADRLVVELWERSFRDGQTGMFGPTLVDRGVVLMRKAGRMAVVTADVGGVAHIWPVGHTALTAKKQGKVDGYLIGRPTTDRKAPADTRDLLWVADTQVRELWVPHVDDPTQPWTPYARTVQALRGLNLIGRKVIRETNQYLAGSRIIHFEGSMSDLANKPGGEQSNLATAIASIARQMKDNLDDLTEKDPRSASFIPYVGQKPPSIIETVRPVDPGLIEVWNQLLKAFADGTPWPTQFVVEGTGSGNHWTDFLSDKQTRQHVIFPIMRQFCALLTVGVLHPLLKAHKISGWETYELVGDVAGSDTEPATPDELQQARDAGLLTRSAYAAKLGLDPADMIALPDGVTEYDMWLASAARRTNRSSSGPASTMTASLHQKWWEG